MYRHPLDYLSLIFGVLFLLVAGFFGVRAWDPFTIDARWIIPAALVLLGLAFLVPSRRRPAELAEASTEPLPAADPVWPRESEGPLWQEAHEELPPSPLD